MPPTGRRISIEWNATLSKAQAQIEEPADRAKRLEDANQRIAELEEAIADGSAKSVKLQSDAAKAQIANRGSRRRAWQLEEANRQATNRCDELTNAAKRQRDDHLRTLAALKRSDYDGRLPRALTGLKRWLPGRRQKFRRLARDYRLVAASPLFDAEWYLANNPDVAKRAGIPFFITSRTAPRMPRSRAALQRTSLQCCQS